METTLKRLIICFLLSVTCMYFVLFGHSSLKLMPSYLLNNTEKSWLQMIKQNGNETTLIAWMTSSSNHVNLSENLFSDEKRPKCKLDVDTLNAERFEVHENSTIAALWNSELKGVKYGGSYSPEECVSEQRLAVIIPYRDRRKHLEILLNNLHTMFQKQKLSYTIFVVEIALPMRFNRGLLLNIGFREAVSISNFDCFVFHDVDLVPVNEKNLYQCKDQPVHLSSGNSKFNYNLPYAGYLGGVVLIRKKDFETVNGYPNVYFGWGGEDDDFARRVKSKKLQVFTQNLTLGKYLALSHGDDSSNPKNPERFNILSGAASRMAKDGLHSLKYHVLSMEFRPMFTWINVKYDEKAYSLA